MVVKKEDFSNASYILGIASIVLAFFTPVAGVIFGIIGIKLGQKQKTPLAKKGIKLSKIGLVIGLIVLVITIVAALLASKISGIINFPQ